MCDFEKQPTMSVVVPAHSRVNLLYETLHSLYMQTSKDFEVIVSDDSSVEEDRLAIKKIVSLFVSMGVNVRYVFTAPRLGQAKNTNQGVNFANGTYVRILHSDDIISPSCIEYEINIFKYYADIDFFYHNAIEFSTNLNFHEHNSHQLVDVLEVWMKSSIFQRTALPSCLCFKKDLYKKVHGMDENYKFLCDWSLFFHFIYDAYKNNKKTLNIDSGYVGWRTHENTVTRCLFLDHFLEHEKFMDVLRQYYSNDNILSEKALRQAIFGGMVYRFDRLYRDFNLLQTKDKTFAVLKQYWRIMLFRRYSICRNILRVVFLPINCVSSAIKIVKNIFSQPEEVKLSILKKIFS